MGATKRDRWTEQEVLNLPPGEPDEFDRKSGALVQAQNFREAMAKALSAFANSGGGSLILGMSDDATFDGVDPIRGATPTREWLEQLLPPLLIYPLDDFRVHVVEPASPSTIPAGKQVIVIDVGDSLRAPHQSAITKLYYHRVGGHSVPASHFYLETLRNRLVGTALTAEVASIVVENAKRMDDGRVRVTFRVAFTIRNVGRIAAYKWQFVFDRLYSLPYGSFADGDYSIQEPRRSYITLDDTILPDPALYKKVDMLLGVVLRPASLDADGIRAELEKFAAAQWAVGFRVVSETSPGEPMKTEVFTILRVSDVVEAIVPQIAT